MDNPFSTLYLNTKGESFCGRSTEISEIKELLANEQNVALISPRRIGKTCLIMNLFDEEEVRQMYHCFYVEIMPTMSLGEFVEALEGAIHKG